MQCQAASKVHSSTSMRCPCTLCCAIMLHEYVCCSPAAVKLLPQASLASSAQHV